MRISQITFMLSVLVFMAGAGQGSIIYSTIPAGDAYNSSYSYAMGGSSSSWGEIDLAAQFTVSPGADLYPDSIEVAIRSYVSTPALIDVMLTRDNLGKPGTVLETSQVIAAASSAIVTADFSQSTRLTAGESYWVRLSVATPTGQTFWHFSQPAISGNCKYSNDDGVSWNGYSTLPAFCVNATVPEPITLGLMLLGGLAAVRRKRR